MKFIKKGAWLEVPVKLTGRSSVRNHMKTVYT